MKPFTCSHGIPRATENCEECARLIREGLPSGGYTKSITDEEIAEMRRMGLDVGGPGCLIARIDEEKARADRAEEACRDYMRDMSAHGFADSMTAVRTLREKVVELEEQLAKPIYVCTDCLTGAHGDGIGPSCPICNETMERSASQSET